MMKFTRNARELESDKRSAADVRVIGITGGIGSGKTVATDALKQAGYTVIDADEISRRLFGKGTDGEKRIARLFPECEKDGVLDRRALRDAISADARKRTALDDLTHPAITAEVERLLAKSPPPCVLSAPLLFEAALARLCDRTVCVYCPRGVKAKRIAERDGVTEKQARAMIDAQIPDTERCSLADYVVPSDRPQSEFTEEILELFEQICKH